MRRLSLFQIVLLAAGGAAVTTGGVMLFVTSRACGQAEQDNLLAKARVYAQVLVQQANLAGDIGQVKRLVDSIGDQGEVLTLAVVGGNPSHVVASKDPSLLGTPAAQAAALVVDAPGGGPGPLEATRTDDAAFGYRLAFQFDNPDLPGLHGLPAAVLLRLDAAAAIAAAHAEQYGAIGWMLGSLALLLLLVLGTVWLHVMRPLDAIGTVLRRRSAGDRDARPGPMPNGDLQELATGLGQMLDSNDLADAQLRAVFAGAADAIVTVDQLGAILQFNPAAETLFGLPAKDAIGSNIARFLPEPTAVPDSAVAQHSGIGRFLGAPREVTALHGDGGTFPCGLAVNAATVHGEHLYVAILRDLTNDHHDRRELERARGAAEAAMQAKSAFLANMSHEIRTPLTAILGYAEELEDEAMSADERRAALQIVQRNGEHLLAVLNSVLDLSKIEAGRMKVECIDCHPDQIASEVVGLMAVRAKDKGLTLDLEFATAMPASVHSDPTRLRQILINLIGNAIKFTERGSVQVQLTCDFVAERFEFAVADTGIGMSKQQLAGLFQTFAQADSTTTRKYGGTGLGLHISRRLASMLGGDITVSSEPGRGSRFACSIATGPLLPATTHRWATEPAAVAPTVPASAAPRLSGRVLLAEDGFDNQLLLRRMLSAAGLQVTVANNGLEAREAVLAAEAAAPFDLVLMDVQMPVMDGLTAARDLRAAGYRRPIVALTANALPEDRERCLQSGCSHFATKPVQRRELFATLSAALGEFRARG
jgi:PAS domain S-box-containing protein